VTSALPVISIADFSTPGESIVRLLSVIVWVPPSMVCFLLFPLQVSSLSLKAIEVEGRIDSNIHKDNNAANHRFF
jgi:hypothetical protein